MTTWDNGDIEEEILYYPDEHRTVYVINGISGDTGGTLTVPGTPHIVAVHASAYTDAGVPIGDVGECIPGDGTVIVSYSDPIADHKIRLTVWTK